MLITQSWSRRSPSISNTPLFAVLIVSRVIRIHSRRASRSKNRLSPNFIRVIPIFLFFFLHTVTAISGANTGCIFSIHSVRWVSNWLPLFFTFDSFWEEISTDWVDLAWFLLRPFYVLLIWFKVAKVDHIFDQRWLNELIDTIVHWHCWTRVYF